MRLHKYNPGWNNNNSDQILYQGKAPNEGANPKEGRMIRSRNLYIYFLNFQLGPVLLQHLSFLLVAFVLSTNISGQAPEHGYQNKKKELKYQILKVIPVSTEEV